MLPALGCTFLHLVCHGYLNLGFYFRLLDSDREPIQDVPAIYFIMPTDDNIRRLCKVRIRCPFVNTFTLTLLAKHWDSIRMQTWSLRSALLTSVPSVFGIHLYKLQWCQALYSIHCFLWRISLTMNLETQLLGWMLGKTAENALSWIIFHLATLIRQILNWQNGKCLFFTESLFLFLFRTFRINCMNHTA